MGTEEHCKQISLACAHSVLTTLGLTCSRCVCFPSLHCSGSRLLCLQLSEAGPGLCALPRSKPFRFRFRFSGTPERRRLSRTCVLCPFHVWAAEATRCLASTVTPRCGVSYTSPIPAAQFAGWQQACPSQVGRPLGCGSREKSSSKQGRVATQPFPVTIAVVSVYPIWLIIKVILR